MNPTLIAISTALALLAGAIPAAHAACAMLASGGDAVQGLHDALLSTMKNGRTLGQSGRFAQLEPVIRSSFPSRLMVFTFLVLAVIVAVWLAGPSRWQWLRWLVVWVGLVTIAIARYSLPDVERAQRPLNPAGAVLYAGTFGLLLAGLQ